MALMALSIKGNARTMPVTAPPINMPMPTGRNKSKRMDLVKVVSASTSASSVGSLPIPLSMGARIHQHTYPPTMKLSPPLPAMNPTPMVISDTSQMPFMYSGMPIKAPRSKYSNCLKSLICAMN